MIQTITEEQAREKALQDVKLYMAAGWDVKEETPQYFLLQRNKASRMGHFFIFLFFGWWLLFIPNILYHYLSREKKKILK